MNPAAALYGLVKSVIPVIEWPTLAPDFEAIQ